MTNSKYVPKRRFKEFELDGEWEQDLLGNIADFSIKTNSFSREKLTHESYEVQNIHYGDIPIKFQSVIDLKRDNLPSIIDSSVLDFRQSLLQDGDVIFADAAEDSTVGKAIEIRNIMGKNVVSGLHTIAARPIQLFAPYYLGYYLNSDFYHKQILPLMQGTKVSSISKSNLQVTEISFPIIDEQKKIGKFFQKIASLIALHQHKLDKLKNLKKSYLAELFPAEGERVPKRRFPGFEGEWEEKKLGEMSNITAGGDVDKDKLLTKGNYPVLANAHTNEGIIGYYEENYQIEAPAVTVTGRGDIGFAKARKENFTPVVRLLSIKSKHNVDFLAEAINQNKVIFESTGVPQLTIPKLSNYKIYFPTEVDEENSIGNFLVSLDSLITLQQQKLDKLNDLKKAYLNELFV